MRAATTPSGASSCALCALLCLGAPGMAQTVPQQDATARSAPAKADGRTGSLSPDEQRRAARGRQRAAAAEKAARERTEAAQEKPADAKPAAVEAAEAKPADAKPAAPGPARDAAPDVPTHRSVAAAPAPADSSRAGLSRGDPLRAEATADLPHPRHVARVHRTQRSRFAAGEPQVDERIPDDASLQPLPPDFARGGFRRPMPRALPYDRVAADSRPVAPPPPPWWGYRPAYGAPPPYPFYRQGW